jgi:two-component system response regulator AtoC
MLSTLLVDDDRAFSSLAAATLAREGLQVSVAHSLHEAHALAATHSFELVILDRRLPDGDGLDALPALKAAQPGAVVVLVTAHGDIGSAVEAMRLGAADYLAKPVELSDLVFKARRASEELGLRARLAHAEHALSTRRSLIAPQAPAMKAAVALLERIGATSPRSPVLLLGETGVGKELLAWHLHQHSAGPAAPFIHVNCAALPEAMAESELFGHERGAFTDAKTARRGLVELANRGTLFLDEVGELSAPLQAKLLTFLDGGRYRRVGAEREQVSTTRVVAATNRDLEAEVKAGRFREDLWFRLATFRVQVPPLRERREDLPSLARGLLARVAQDQGRREVPTLTPEALARLTRYPFPGNVRELRSILERALVLESAPALTLAWLGGEAAAPAEGDFVVRELEPLESLERRYARWALERLGGRRMDTAKALGVSHPTFNKLTRGDDSPPGE